MALDFDGQFLERIFFAIKQIPPTAQPWGSEDERRHYADTTE